MKNEEINFINIRTQSRCFFFFLVKFKNLTKFLVKCRETNQMLNTLHVLSPYLLEKCSGLILRQSQSQLLLLLLLLLLFERKEKKI